MKYIIEIDDKPLIDADGDKIYRATDFDNIVFDEYDRDRFLEPLVDEKTARTSEMSGYLRGWEDGRKSAWIYAGTLYKMDEKELHNIFVSPDGKRGLGVAFDMSIDEASKTHHLYNLMKTKIEKESSKEINPGDEVIGEEKVPYVVTVRYKADGETKERCCGYDSKGFHYYDFISDCTKTGRHFDQVADVMRLMQGEE